MWRMLTKSIAPLALVGILVGCGSSYTDEDLQTGLRWHIASYASFGDDYEFDRYSGKVLLRDPSTTGLSRLPAELPEDDVLYESAIAEATDWVCERYASPYGDDPFEGQGRIVRGVLFGTSSSITSKKFSNELFAAMRDFEKTRELFEMSFDERDQYWIENYGAELAAERDRFLAAPFEEDRAPIFTEDNILRVQKLIINHCELEVPLNYVYPSPEELGLDMYIAPASDDETVEPQE